MEFVWTLSSQWSQLFSESEARGNLLETANVGQLSTHILKPDMIFPNSQISRFKAVTPSLNEVEWFEQFSNILNI